MHAERARKKQGFVELKKDLNLENALTLKRLLEEHFKTVKSVSFYAEKMNVSPKTLNQTTLKIFGKSPKSIIDERVILECKRLLVHSNMSIKEIAFHLGFEEPTNFNKYFKKHLSTTPAHFREKYR